MARHRARDAHGGGRRTATSREDAASGIATWGRPQGGSPEKSQPEEAAVVRRIFEMCRTARACIGSRRVLNGEASRLPAQQDRPAGWVPSSVGASLAARLLPRRPHVGPESKAGRVGSGESSKRPQSEWMTVRCPAPSRRERRAVEAAHERMRASRQNYLRATDGKLWGKSASRGGVEVLAHRHERVRRLAAAVGNLQSEPTGALARSTTGARAHTQSLHERAGGQDGDGRRRSARRHRR